MTESEWLAATEPQAMLEFLRNTGRADERRLRLFGCACVRKVWHLLTDERSRKAVELAERFADGRAAEDELLQLLCPVCSDSVSKSARDVDAGTGAGESTPAEVEHYLASLLIEPSRVEVDQAAQQALWLVGHAHMTGRVLRSERWFGNDNWWRAEAEAGMASERASQAALVRCLFGNPFRAPPELPASLLKWGDGTVVQIARRAYQERGWSLLPILADALEDAGLAETRVSEHLRGGGPHARGCWVVDAILEAQPPVEK